MPESATLTVVGLGPGDPELVTVKGVRAIEAADVIFVPRSTDEADSVALRIAGPWLTGRQAVVPVTTPMTRDAEALRAAWESIAAEIGGRLAGGGQGAYLLLGDPLLYGTFTYIAEILAATYPAIAVEFVPGITSFAAGAARTRTPLTMTSDRLAIIPASRETNLTVLRRLLADFATLILMKAGPVFPQIMAALEELGLVDQAVYVERIGLPEERIMQGGALRRLERTRRPYLSLMIVRRGEATLPVNVPAERAARAEQPVYPINLSQVAGRRVVVVGGGAVGERKVRGLLAAQAAIELISPAATPQLQAWAAAGTINWQRRAYQSGDLMNAMMVFAATDQRAVNAQVAREAAELSLLRNIADAPEEGDFYLPAVHRQAGVTVAVSTSGESPRRAAELRDRLAAWLGDELQS
jgi:precorrin-2/cobalt-factor-2 C20-methyltransferase